MKITKVETYAIQAENTGEQEYWGKRSWVTEQKKNQSKVVVPEGLEYPPKWRMRASYSDTIDTCIVKVQTNEGIIGWGEAKAPVAPKVVKTIIDELLTPIILNRDPFETEVLWEKMYSTMRLRGHLSGFFLEAISGIDIALWDILGKSLNQPIYKLLGGAFRDEINLYGSGVPGLRQGADQDAVNQLIRDTENLLQKGFNAIKIAGGHGITADKKTIEIVRDVAGSQCALYLDTAGNYNLKSAKELGEFAEEYGVGFLEAPAPPELISVYSELSNAINIPIASDLITSRYQAQAYFEKKALDLVQPDICRAGGITECRKIAFLADVNGAAFAPHVSIGSAIHFAASAHLAAAVPNFMIMEYWAGVNPIGSAILKTPFEQVNGKLKLPQKPGLGIDIIEDKLLAYAN
ncbi:mandelate racemase/muconate lactonizing enzyme family protein [Novibacillus thermophilus]|uniref:Mandelate racemase/muconate lactonizing enzyme C-terminal domain-containing protein n=1 Tax=Novibacillus thermophilus TaxID=1471761 RepID=A0A1U9KA64_9BACL|nr:mandelate racemase/muconate lactonizing enzyme family protein [Novibacillus thermophilus]AQS56959.1 hypothetical protein B0W44_15605 [Novibacillus thermophilus]